MIRLFGINDIDFRSNGERIIRARKAEVYRDIDGEYKLYLQAPLDETIETNSIIVAPTPWGEQPFRVYTVESGMYSRTIYARHIFFDAMNYLLDDVAPTGKNAKDALEWIIARTDSPNYFTADSDILDIKTTRHVNKSLYDAVYDLAQTYGGYVVPDGLQIGIYSSLGADKGVTIRYGKNLKGISATENWDNVCTKLLPIGHEGIELPEKYVEADVQYDIPYSRTIRFNPSMGIDVTDEEALIEDLRAQAEVYVEANKYPQVNYTVEAFEENVDLGDTIHVLHEKADIDILTAVISITYDCIRKKTIRIEFGNFRPSIKGLAKTINETQKSVETERVERITKTTALEKALEQSEETIMDYLTKGYKYITENAIYFLDNQDPSLAEHVMMMSLGGIAFGEQGINGPFTTAWDIEGNFNAEFITTGSLNADLIQSGILKSQNYDENGGIPIAGTKFDLENGNLIMVASTDTALQIYDEDSNLIGGIDVDEDDNLIFVASMIKDVESGYRISLGEGEKLIPRPPYIIEMEGILFQYYSQDGTTKETFLSSDTDKLNAFLHESISLVIQPVTTYKSEFTMNATRMYLWHDDQIVVSADEVVLDGNIILDDSFYVDEGDTFKVIGKYGTKFIEAIQGTPSTTLNLNATFINLFGTVVFDNSGFTLGGKYIYMDGGFLKYNP